MLDLASLTWCSAFDSKCQIEFCRVSALGSLKIRSEDPDQDLLNILLEKECVTSQERLVRDSGRFASARVGLGIQRSEKFKLYCAVDRSKKKPWKKNRRL